MWSWLNRLWGGNQPPSVPVDPQFVDRLVKLANPTIRSADDYQEKLAPLVWHACQNMQALREKLASPVALTPENWRQNPMLSLVFANPDRMAAAIAGSEDVRDWFHAHPLAQEAFAILGVTRLTETRYGMEEQDGLVRQDVLQQVLVFREPRFGALVDSASALENQAERRAVEELAHHAARRINGLEAEKALVEEELNTLRIALRMGGPTDAISASLMQRKRLARIEQLSRELVNIRAALEPQAQLDMLAAALRHPEQELRFTETELAVDLLGVIGAGRPQARTVTLFEIEMIAGEPVRRVLFPVIIPRSAIPAAGDADNQPSLFNSVVY